MPSVIDGRPPKFGKVRWLFVRTVLATTNVVERTLTQVREWALREAVASSPSFETFQTYITKHYADRGLTAKVSVVEATVVATPAPRPTHFVNGSTHLH